MADSPLLPGSHAWRDASGRPLPVEFYRFLRDLVAFIQATSSNTESISALSEQLAELLSRTYNLTGVDSVQVLGLLKDGATVRLVGDENNPLPAYFYATDDDRAKGFHPLYPHWVPNPYADYLVDENGNYLVDENGNFLTAGDPNPQFDPLGSAAAALTAAMDFTSSEIDDLTPESLGMAPGYDSTNASRLTDLDTVFGQPPMFFSALSTAANIPVAISGQGAWFPFSSTAGMMVYTSSSSQNINRRFFFRAGSGSVFTDWIEFSFRYWNAVTAASGSFTPNLDTNDAVIRTALATVGFTVSNPTGTKVNGRELWIRLRDNGTGRAIAWGSEYRSMTATLPATTTANKTLYCHFIVNADETTLDLMSVAEQP